MARARFSGFLIAVGAVLCAGPAATQWGTILGDVPRPPGNVPGRPAPPPPYPPQQGGDAQATAPQRGGVQSQPLPPPPGTEPAQQGALGRPGQAPAPGQPAGQRPPRGTPQQGNTAPQPGDQVVNALPSEKIVNPTAVFSGLDKITGRIITFDVAINETVQFGALQVTPRTCYTRPPTETPNTDGFVEVDEITLQGEIKRIFTGWMFAASPGLHGVEHPIYDVWLADCKKDTPTLAAGTPASSAPAAAASPSPPTQKR
jgi:hypothetical protein